MRTSILLTLISTLKLFLHEVLFSKETMTNCSDCYCFENFECMKITLETKTKMAKIGHLFLIYFRSQFALILWTVNESQGKIFLKVCNVSINEYISQTLCISPYEEIR